jgi:starvation-inducible DNA-binding protein
MVKKTAPKTAPAGVASLRIDIGISDKDRAAVAGGLSKLLANTYTLYLMTHNFHWNVTGPMFNTLHTMFMDQYTALWGAIDPVAERIRALGHYAPGTYREFGKLATIAEPIDVPEAMEMVRMLVGGHEAVAKTARDILKVADAASDEPTADLLTQRLDFHEKTAWMLRSLLQ